MHVVIVTSCELARESLMGVRPCQVKVQSACWHCCCRVCPFSVFSKMPHLLRFSLQFDSTNTTKLQDLDVWSFFSFPRDPELRKTRSKLKVTSQLQWPSGGTKGLQHQFTKEDRGDVNLTADDETAPGVVRLRAMYLTQHCRHAAKTTGRWVRAPLERVERLKLGSRNCALMASVECDLGRDLCLVSRYCLNQSAAPVHHHHVRSLSVPRWRWQLSDRLPLTPHWLPHIRSLQMACHNLLESDAKPKLKVLVYVGLAFFLLFFFCILLGQSFGCFVTDCNT